MNELHYKWIVVMYMPCNSKSVCLWSLILGNQLRETPRTLPEKPLFSY